MRQLWSARPPQIGVIAATGPVLFGCSVFSGCTVHSQAHFGVNVAKTTLESRVSSSLEKQIGRAPTAVACDGGLEGEVGKTQRCELTDGSAKYGLTVTVTEVEGSKVDFHVQVDDQPAD